MAICGDCRSPHNQRGEETPGRELRGAALAFQPSLPIAGLEGWTNSEAVHFLKTDLDRSKKHPGAPMPQYRMSRLDADAVVAYLKSLRIGIAQRLL